MAIRLNPTESDSIRLMNVTRNGKIARLPKAVRDELNRRLQNGQPGKTLVEWLNSLSEVQAVLATEFGGRPIREQNISEWRKGGHREWLAQQEALAMVRRVAADADELQQAATEPLTDKLAPWLVARYFVAAKALATENGEMDWKLLRELCYDMVALRRGDHYAARLRLEREQFAAANKEHGLRALDRVLDEATQWPDVQKLFKEVFAALKKRKEGWPVSSQSAAGPGSSQPARTQSNPVEPNQTDSSPIKSDQTESNQNKPVEGGSGP